MTNPAILITGANRGIGLELTGQFAEDGWQVLAFCRNPAAAGESRKNLAAKLDRSPLMRSYGYASADDQSTLFAVFSLNFVPFMQYTD